MTFGSSTVVGALAVNAVLLAFIALRLRLLGRLWQIENDAMKARIHAEHGRDSAGRVMHYLLGAREMSRVYWGDPPYLESVPENKPPWYFDDKTDYRIGNGEEGAPWPDTDSSTLDVDFSTVDSQLETAVISVIQAGEHAYREALQLARTHDAESQWLYEAWTAFESGTETLRRFLYLKVYHLDHPPYPRENRTTRNG